MQPYDDEDWREAPGGGDAYDEEDLLACPECGAEVYADADACPVCGYFLTEADRTAAWRAGSATERIKWAGLTMIALTVLAFALRRIFW